MFVLWMEEVWLEGGGGVDCVPLGERVQRSVPQAVSDSSLIKSKTKPKTPKCVCFLQERVQGSIPPAVRSERGPHSSQPQPPLADQGHRAAALRLAGVRGDDAHGAPGAGQVLHPGVAHHCRHLRWPFQAARGRPESGRESPGW